jgi:O-glycosyl hydrolase
MKQRLVKTVAMLVAMTMGLAGVVHTASASVVGTRAVMMQAERAETVARVQAAFDRVDLRAQLEAQGVDPAAAMERVAALTDEELRYLDGRLAELPAGADVVAVVGIVFIVLLILELVGVTDIFKSF